MSYKILKDHYENCLKTGETDHEKVDWPNEEDAITRYQVMLDVIKPGVPYHLQGRVIDFGCGIGSMFEHFFSEEPYAYRKYLGVDISPEFIKEAKRRHPDTEFQCLDITACPDAMPRADYIIANGVFTEKQGMTHEEMWTWVMDTLMKLFDKCDVGLAVNFMSKSVDWERDDLFHLSMDLFFDFCKNCLGTRNVVMRNDYGLYEWTAYVYK